MNYYKCPLVYNSELYYIDYTHDIIGSFFNDLKNDYKSPYHGIRIANPPRIFGNHNAIGLSTYFNSRTYIHGVANGNRAVYMKTSQGLTKNSLEDLELMLHFKSEPVYERPYRLIADSKLCLKGNCHTISAILRPSY